MTGFRTYIAAASIAEAAEALRIGARVLAGGTDLMLQAGNGGGTDAGTLLNISRIGELRGVGRDDGQIRIGALTTMTDVLADPLIAETAPVLARAADSFASSQIRNAATVGGNICNASPAGDMIVPLLLLDAEVELAAWRDGAVASRRLPLDQVFLGPGQTCIEAEELLTAVVFPAPAAGFWARYRKSGPRPALEISIVALGIAGIRDGDALRGVRIAMGAVAPTPLRARKAEALLEGRALDEAAIAEAAAAIAEEASPIDDVRGSAWYRRHLLGVYAERLLRDAEDD
ncbi:MAG: xanthine dehydrogenase family protein subunit M [Alphaproteobacteria bacterium]|nr:xanthine dehydrogenase family protein subunit M [Alphaproteobacteria bacterium]MDP6563326.1 xanthine dehydrogenase family protein subunit M [Alphaproteobacteria bacterium]MDP6814852.1 xanthine dehydrogenase family protein subunit M [Alphaproteobacteria bacterium]